MTNKTFIPAFKAKVGDWEYYICIMKYAEVARQVQFAHELGGNSELNTMIQRGLSARTGAIKEYLLKSEHRFLGALIIAAWGGAPEYRPIAMDDPDGMLTGIDRQFGVLTFDGTQSYFALDGQHRLKAIKEALKQKPELGHEDVCVIMVSHFDSEEGKVRTRRLFTNINRNANSTTRAENIVLDEDDGPAIITRRLITEHPFLARDGVIKVFTRQGEEGDIKLAAGNVAQGDKKAFTTIGNLYDLVRSLCFDLDSSMRKQDARPSDEVLENSYTILAKRLDDIIKAAGDVRAPLEADTNARDLRAPKGREAEGNPFMRPVVQKSVVRMVSQIANQGVLNWDELMARLTKMNWKIGQAPWLAVFNPANGKMVGAKENTELLDKLIYVHLAASSKQAIKDARKEFKEVRGIHYPISEEDLQKNLTPHTERRVSIPELVSSEAAVAEEPAEA
ncbi:DNA sulfur modification protein DndB [Methylobacterium sp. AMS5]|uniref:DNA sulfur modification protein DndB n=1 Tax=Methylobacterium sp. AMS5 TaxID=925818 RepID=UPI00074F8D53|nr:DNA sulfur modification protein DndB [Methylobacterium sp. AMS5]AMB45065.1 DNA sulfur modification protein DndB [Methylobacterium sp. AMS5]